MVPLKYLSNFWRTVEILLLICEINLILTWSLKCVIASNIAANQATTVVITDTKLYIPIVTLSTQDNAKLLQQIKSGFNRTIYWNKYQSKVSIQAPNIYLGYLIDPGFQWVNRLLFYHLKKYRENSKKKKKKKKKSSSSCRNKGLKCYDQWEKIFGQPVKNDLATYDNIKKIAVGQGDDYTTGCLLDYNYFKDYFKIIAID